MAGFWSQSNSQIHDLNGRPLIGARAFFFLAGTLTPLTPYGSYNLGAVNALPNPVESNGAGFFPSVFLDEADEFYRVRITSATGVIIYDVDGIPIIGPNASGGGGSETPVNPDAVMTTGDMVLRYGTGLRSGFVRANGRTVGSSTSGASERANADVQGLYEHLWGADTALVVSGGRGASAAADWAANKPLALPDFRGRTPIGLDTMGNIAAAVVPEAVDLGDTGGLRTHTLSVGEMPNHNHNGFVVAGGGDNISIPFGLEGVNVSAGGTLVARPGTTVVGQVPHQHVIQAQGGGAAHNNLQPYIAVSWYVKI